MKRNNFILSFLCLIFALNINAQINYFNIPVKELNGKIQRISTTKYSYSRQTGSLIKDSEIIFKEFDYLKCSSAVNEENNTVSFKDKIVTIINDSSAYYNWLKIPIQNFNLFKYLKIKDNSKDNIKKLITFGENGNIVKELFENSGKWNETFENEGTGTIIEKEYFAGDSTFKTITYLHYNGKHLIGEYSIAEGQFNYSYDFFYNAHVDIEFVIHTKPDMRYLIKYEYVYDKNGNWIECNEYHSFNFSGIIENNKLPVYVYKREIEYY